MDGCDCVQQALRQRRRMRRHIGVKEAIQRVRAYPPLVRFFRVFVCHVSSACVPQHWDLLTSMKPEDAKYVTKDEYIAYFLVAYGVLMPDEDVETSAKLVAIEVSCTLSCFVFEDVGAHLTPVRRSLRCRRTGKVTAVVKMCWIMPSSTRRCLSLLVRAATGTIVVDQSVDHRIGFLFGRRQLV